MSDILEPIRCYLFGEQHASVDGARIALSASGLGTIQRLAPKLDYANPREVEAVPAHRAAKQLAGWRQAYLDAAKTLGDLGGGAQPLDVRSPNSAVDSVD